MASSVTAPLERYLGHIAGITQMTSTSTLGTSRIILQFDLSRDIDGASRDVQSAINEANSQLPANLPILPSYRKVNPADTPILVMALTSPTLSVGEIYDAASTILQQKISQMAGVGQVLVVGSSLPAVRVELNPTALNSYGIGLPAVAHAIATANVNLPKGQLTRDATTSAVVTMNDQLMTAREYAPIIIGYQNNSPVRLSDVGELYNSIEDVRNAGLFNGKPAVLLVIFKQPGVNVIETVDRVIAALPQLQASIPAGIETTISVDKTQTIRVSLFDVEMTLIIAMLLVILVTYCFLGSIRATLIPGIAVPLSLLGTFGVMKLLGYSLDNLSFMALIISTGFVVDDAVVVLENVSRHLEEGVPPFQAALRGAKEVSFTVISMSLSLIAVFIPILLMGGLVGRLFREFAVTLSVAIVISMLVSLTLTPMMCSRWLHRIKKTESNRWVRAIDNLRHAYQKGLDWSLQHVGVMFLIMVTTLLSTIFLFIMIPKGFFPQQDIGLINGTIQTDQNISFQALHEKLIQFVDIVQHDPAVKNVTGIVGGATNTSPGSLYITLKDRDKRQSSADEVINRLRSSLAKVTGAVLYLQASQDVMIGGRQTNAQFQYTLVGDNVTQLNQWAERVKKALRHVPGIIDVNSDERDEGLQSYVTIDHDTASRLGITTEQIDATLYHAFGQSQVSTMFRPMNQYHVVMEVAPKYWQRPDTLEKIYIVSATGKEVPLSAIARFDSSSTVLSVNHQGQSPAVTLSFNLLPAVPLDKAVNAVNRVVEQLHVPASIQGSFQGTAQAFQSSLANEPYLIVTALLAVYIVLGMLYESWVHPITILSTLPSAGVGALLALWVMRTEFSIIALIGVILLIGVVKKNAIMMIDFALQIERHEHKSPRDAIYQAALLRFRPIMMTTLAAMLGALPLIVALGLGAELRRPLGITIFGGLLVSQLLTLYTTPVIYLTMDRMKRATTALFLRLKTGVRRADKEDLYDVW